MSAAIRQVKRFTLAGCLAVVALLVTLGSRYAATVVAQNAAKGQGEIPTFQFDAAWPKPLPNNWNTGNIGAMVVDSKDHIWVVHRPGTTTGNSHGNIYLGESIGNGRVQRFKFVGMRSSTSH